MEERAAATMVVIAGGRGRRLGGVPKGLLRLGDSTLIERTLDVLPEGRWLVNANQPEPYEFLGLPVVGDIWPGHGSPGGIVTALAVSATPWVLAVACDMPLLRRESLERLLSARAPDSDVICFERDGDLEPLVGLYRRDLLSRWVQVLPANPSMRGLIRAVRLRTLKCEDPSELDSINTPEDVRRLGVRQP